MFDIDYIINGKKPKKKKTKQHKETNDPFAAVLGKNYKSKDGGPSLSNDFLSIFNGSTSKKNKSKGKSKQSQKPSAGMVNPAAAMGVGNMSGILNDKKTKKQNKLLQNTKMKSGKGHKRFSDWDKDGVINGLDCAPMNPYRHMAIRWGRKPKNMDRQEWEEKKTQFDEMTHKENPNMDPSIKKETVLKHDRELNKLNKVHGIHKDEKWHSDYNKEAIKALQEQGYSEDEAQEYLSEKSRKLVNAGNYFAQEMSKDPELGKYFKKAASKNPPISDEEGLRRYEDYKQSSQYISDIKKPKKEQDETDLQDAEPVEDMYEQDDDEGEDKDD